MSVTHPLSKPINLLELHRYNPDRYPFLLQTVAPSHSQQHFDILFACPVHSIVLQRDGRTALDNTGKDTCWAMLPDELGHQFSGKSFLSIVNELFSNGAIANSPQQSRPFSGGYFIYLAYEFLNQIESTVPIPNHSHVSQTLPLAFLTRIPLAVMYDHQNRLYSIVSEPGFEHAIDAIMQDIAQSGADRIEHIGASQSSNVMVRVVEEPEQVYLHSIEKIKRYIREGDVFQVNLSRQWQAQLPRGISAQELYINLCSTNPAPFAACVYYNNSYIVSSSPERLLRVQNRCIETRPIAGTRPRSGNNANDQQMKQELIAHPKERAEHIMLIDLERNDLGRICEIGSIDVNELMVLESYAHVHHIVSNVRGRIREGVLPGDVIRALFPGGTITGCPKVRCMQIIAELEQQSRGAYTGSLGYINHNGDMELNILIRTLQLSGDELSFRAGGGIVADSIGQRELEETRAKAKGMLLALNAKI